MRITSNNQTESPAHSAKGTGIPNHPSAAPYPTMNQQLLEWQASCTSAALDLCSGDKRSLRSVLLLIQYAARFANTKGTLDDGRQFCEMSRRQLASELGWSQGRVTRALALAEPFLRRVGRGSGLSASRYEYVGISPVESEKTGTAIPKADNGQEEEASAAAPALDPCAAEDHRPSGSRTPKAAKKKCAPDRYFRQFIEAFGAGCGRKEAETFDSFQRRVREGFRPQEIVNAAARYRTEPLMAGIAERWRYPLKFLDDDSQFYAYCKRERESAHGNRDWSLSNAKVVLCIERSRQAVVVHGPTANQMAMIDLPRSLRGADEGTVRNWLIQNHEGRILREFGLGETAA